MRHYHRMSRDPEGTRRALVAGLAGTLLLVTALLRWGVHRSLSPVDLAFFTQSAWNALQGRGFAQTALSFEGSSLWSCVHWSPIRLLHLPFVAVGAWGLVVLQVLLVSLAALLLGRLGRGQGVRGSLLVLACSLHPLSVTLALADARPIVFFLPLVVLAVIAIEEGRSGWLTCCLLPMSLVREEAPFLMLALVPWALGRGPRPVLLLLAGASFSSCLLWIWGGAGVDTHPDALAHLGRITSGQAPLFRDPDELRFALLGLVLLPWALLCPRLLLPGLLGWAYLLVFSTREPAHADGAGAHYLAVVHPFVLAAAAVGSRRLAAAERGRVLLAVGLGVGVLVGGLTLLPRVSSWTAEREEAAARWELLRPIVGHRGAVLAPEWAAPALARREGLWVSGHIDTDAAGLARVSAQVEHALLPAERSDAESMAWAEALRAEGLRPVQQAAGFERWGR